MQDNESGNAPLTTEQMEQLKKTAACWSDMAQDCAADLAKVFERQIIKRPATSLLAALAAGVVLGWMIKRR